MPVQTPDLFWLTLEDMLVCICNALNSEGECECPCRVCVTAGPASPDDCCQGQLHAWFDRIFFHDNFPQANAGAMICGTFLAGDFTIERLMCAPVLNDDGEAPSCPELSESARLVYKELYIALTALNCCLAEAKRHRKYLITSGTVKDPNGGCVGWQIKGTIELHDPPLVTNLIP